MNNEKKRNIGIALLVGLLIFGSVFIFIWNSFLNWGNVRLIGSGPFTVLTLNGEKISCVKSPCEFRQKSGIKDFVVYKEGYKSVSIEMDVKLWRTNEYVIEFPINPYIQSVGEIPQDVSEKFYEIVLDSENSMYKLIDKEDKQKHAIVFFPKKIENYIIFGNKNAALVAEKEGSIYRINILRKEREAINGFDFSGIEKGKWSENGKYFAFTKNETEKIYVMDKKSEVKETQLNKGMTTFSWTYDDKLLYVTNDSTKTQASTGYGFGLYDTEINTYESIENFNEILSLPEILIPKNNNAGVYFTAGDESFELVLKKF